MKVVLSLIVVALIAGCLLVWHSYRTVPASPEVLSSGTTYTTGTFGYVSMRLELAENVNAQETGLGGRTNVPDGYGMLFIFPIEGDYGFWMKDMQVPIDIFWLDDNGQVVTMKQTVSPDTYPNVFYPSSDVKYVLETRAGFARDHQITIGSKLEGLPPSESVL